MVSKGDMEFGLTSRESSPNREAPNKHIRGSKNYKEMIDKGSKAADRKNLPFKFGKPKSESKLGTFCECKNCGHVSNVSKNTIMIVCSSCRTLYKVTDDVVISE